MVWLRSLPFLLLFPGYFAYHWSALSGWLPYILGGYVNEVSVLVCIGFGVAWVISMLIKIRLSESINKLDKFFFFFMAWFAGVVIVHAALSVAPGVTKNLVAAWVQMLACYLATRVVLLDKIRVFLIFSTVIFSGAVLWAAYSDLLGLLLGSDLDSSAATYQGFARAFLLTAVCGLAGFRYRFFCWFFYVVVLFVLFLIGARSEIIGAAIVFLVQEVIASRRPLRMVLVLFFCIAVVVFVVFGRVDTWLDLFPHNRFLGLIIDGDEDFSVAERSLYQDFAWRAVLDSPFWGDYGHYEKEFSAGAYAHNWLSAWVDLGLIGLFLYFYVHLIASSFAVKIFIIKNDFRGTLMEKDWSLAISLLVMIIAFNFFGKTFSDSGLATVAGFLSLVYSCGFNSAHFNKRLNSPS